MKKHTFKAVALYTQGNREEGMKLAKAELILDKRLADLKYLKENMWGERFLKDARKLLQDLRT